MINMNYADEEDFQKRMEEYESEMKRERNITRSMCIFALVVIFLYATQPLWMDIL